jgi:hypothetical protein
MHPSDLISWVGGALVGIALTWGFDAIRAIWLGRRGPMRGIWWQSIPVFDDQPQKLDKVKCRHTGNSVSAGIRRTEPDYEVNRAWKFEGRIQGNLLYGIFFSHNASDLSYGTIQLHKHDELGTVWKGTYSRLRLRSQEESWIEYLPHIPLEWRRVQPVKTCVARPETVIEKTPEDPG